MKKEIKFSIFILLIISLFFPSLEQIECGDGCLIGHCIEPNCDVCESEVDGSTIRIRSVINTDPTGGFCFIYDGTSYYKIVGPSLSYYPDETCGDDYNFFGTKECSETIPTDYVSFNKILYYLYCPLYSNEELGQICKCINTFYEDETGLHCNENECDATTDYVYVFNKRCYKDSCPDEKNTKSVTDGSFVCGCKFNYTEEGDGKLICLGENKDCSFYNSGARSYEFNRYCYDVCPSAKNAIANPYDSDSKKCVCQYRYTQEDDEIQTLNCLGSDEPCPADTYEFNKRCYYDDCPDVTNLKTEITKGTNQCECQFKYYINPSTSLTICRNEAEPCPSGYNYIFNDQCFQSACPDPTNMDSVDESGLNVCKCKFNYYEYKVTGKTGIIKTKYVCLAQDILCKPGYYLFNRKCYQYGCPEEQNAEIDPYSIDNFCRCKYKFYKEGNELNCLGENEHCPDGRRYFESNSNECKTESEWDDSHYPHLRKIEYTLGGITKYNYQCITECNKSEFINKVSSKNYCVNECPSSPYYYYPDKRECLSSCGEDFTDEETNTCHKDCNKYIVNKTSPNKNYCLDSCPSTSELNFPFLFQYEGKDNCVNSCGVTVTKFSKKSYEYTNTITGTKLCLLDCSKQIDKPFTALNNKCVEKCEPSQYFYKNVCYADLASVQIILGHAPYVIKDTKECFSDGCPTGYEANGNDCYIDTSILDVNNRFIDIDTGKYVPCYTTSSAITGVKQYRYNGKCYPKCPNNAPYSAYHGNIEGLGRFFYECFSTEKGCSEIDGFNYYDYNKPYSCVRQCSSLGGWNSLEFVQVENKDSAGNIIDHICIKSSICPQSHPFKYLLKCYKDGCPSFANKYTYYDITNKNTECFKEDNECTSSSHGFIQGDYCVQSCDVTKYPYKINGVVNSKPGYCLETIEQCYEKKDISTGKYYVYTDSSNTCLKDCLASDYKIEEDEEIYTFTENVGGIETLVNVKHPFKRTGGTCITSGTNCPKDFPYKLSSTSTCYKNKCPEIGGVKYYASNGYGSSDFYECVTCPSGYIYKNKACVTNCENTDNKFHFFSPTSNPNCLESCIQDESHKYFKKLGENYICENSCSTGQYYHPVTQECFSSCFNVKGYEFTPTGSTPRACISDGCGVNEVYKLEDKKCISKSYCLSLHYYISKDGKQCLSLCESNEKIDETNPLDKKCEESCENLFYLREINGRNVEICTNDCTLAVDNNGVTKNLKFYLESNKKCVEHCTTQENFLDGDVCREKCPEEKKHFKLFNFGTGTYYICMENCDFHVTANPNNVYYVNEELECLTQCPANRNHLIKDEVTGIIGKECIERCPKDYYLEDNTLVLNHVVCVKNCQPGKYILDSQCVDTCKDDGSKYKPYLDTTKNECVEECPIDAKIYEKVFTNSPDNTRYYYKCSNTCSNYLTPEGECVESYKDCPSNYNYINSKDGFNYCQTSCDSGDFYKEIIDPTPPSSPSSLKYYKCLGNSCTSELYQLEGDFSKECYLKCPSGYFTSSSNKICRKLCITNTNINEQFSFIADDLSEYKCSDSCGNGIYKYFDKKDKLCKNSCGTINILLDPINGCVSHCDIGSTYKFEEGNECKSSCTTYSKYYKDSYKCVNNCAAPNNFLVEDSTGKFICETKCTNDLLGFAYKTDVESEYHCQNECQIGKLYYYEDDKICKEDCGDGYIVDGSYKCQRTCDQSASSTNKYFYEPSTGSKKCLNKCTDSSDKTFTLSSNHCSVNCKDDETSPYYLPSDKICLTKCPKVKAESEPVGTLPKDKYITTGEGFQCLSGCESEPVNKYLNEYDECVSSCEFSTNGYIYYSPQDKICKQKCTDLQYIYEEKPDILFQCLENCPNNPVDSSGFYAPYAYGNICIDECPSDMPFIIDEFIYSETDTQKKCLTDCPIKYKYYYEKAITDPITSTLYLCAAECPAGKTFIYKDPDPERNRLICTDKCEKENKYKYVDSDGVVHCLPQCPEEKPYYIPNSLPTASDIECYRTCTDSDKKYHLENSFECINSCDASYYIDLDVDPKACISSCLYPRHTAEKEGKDVCVNDCSSIDQYLTYEGECVTDCDPTKFLKKNEAKHICECDGNGLYYINPKTKNKVCLDKNLDNCYKDSVYKYSKSIGAKECLRDCETVTTPEDICLDEIKCPENMYLYYLSDGSRKCLCRYGFYRKPDGNSVCLEKDELCPSSLTHRIAETKECVEACPANSVLSVFENFCYYKCPPNSNQGINVCTTANYWYQKSQFELVFLNGMNCIGDFPYLIEEKKQCVPNCVDTEYPYLSGKKCIKATDCSGGTVEFETGSDLKKIALGRCQCSYQWYYDENGKEGFVCKTAETPCNTIATSEYIYEVYDTKQCTKSCPYLTPYKFNYQCFINCNDASSKLGISLKLKEGTTNECICVNPWTKVDDPNLPGTYKTECGSIPYCSEDGINPSESLLLIKETSQCVPGPLCPNSDPLKFNNDCYKSGKCPSGTKEDRSIANRCICIKLWYTSSDPINKIACIDSSITDCRSTGDFPYLIESTNECVDTCPSDYSFIYNNICKSSCPEGTKVSSDGINCECDKVYGNWYTDTENGFPVLICGKEDQCPEDKKYLNKETLECVNACPGNFFLFKNICYKDKCPEGTESSEEDSSICVTPEIEEAKDLEELHNLVELNIQSLYEKNTTTGFNYDKFNVSLQIYPLNKNRIGYEKNYFNKSLTMINLDDCIENVYKYNELDDDEDIIVAKYDLYKDNKSYIFNPPEYSFYSSKTGKKLDVTICEDKSVTISYPLIYYLKTNFHVYNETYVNKLKNSFILGESLYNESKDIDIFNYNSKIYYDLCTPFVLKGKDVVFRDRRNLLYPKMALCEKNCVPFYTDYEEERIYCNCSVKSEINFKRNNINPTEYSFSKEETDSIQRGPTNFPSLRCIDNLSKDKKNTIKNNGGFYFTVIIVVLEVILFFVTIFIGYNKMVKIIFLKIGLDRLEQKRKDETENNTLNINNNNNIKESKRKMNSEANPPPKKDEKITERRIKNIDYGEKVDVKEYIGDEIPKNKDDFTLLERLRDEEKLMKSSFSHSYENDDNPISFVIVTEILDKIYLTRIILFLKKYDILYLYISLYLLYHLLIITLLTSFYSIDVISQIYTKNKYPDASYYLLYGFITLLITFVIYRLFTCLIKNDEKIGNLIRRRNFYKDKGIELEVLEDKYKDVLFRIKLKIVVFFILEFILLIFCFLYVTIFCGLYIKTKKKVFISYVIALAEILIIKILYGVILGTLRKVSIIERYILLYKIISFFDNYLS